MSNALILFIYILTCYGIANTIIYAHGPFHVFDWLHKTFEKIHPQLNELISCFICLPWWIGFFFSALNLFFLPMVPLTPMNMLGIPTDFWYVIIFLDGAFTSGIIWILDNIEEALERTNQNG